ncbi:MAG: hypothetical protein IH623_06280 [Verrucomicrobia bacterium]|nr:hypothetical protein [Verrucomicrobiota bacterium]
MLPLNTRPAQRLLQQVRPWIEPAQSYEKNQLGFGQMFFNSLRFTWCMPKASFIGCTGTPIEYGVKNTQAGLGDLGGVPSTCELDAL